MTIQIKDPKAPATSAQVSYLESLVKDRDLPAVCERYALLNGLGALTKGHASEFIDQLLKAPKKAPQAVKASAVYVAKPGDTEWKPVGLVESMASIEYAETPISAPFGYYEDPTTGQMWFWEVTSKDYYPQLRMLVLPSGSGYWAPKKASWKKVYSTGNYKKTEMTFTPYAGKKGIGEMTKVITIPGQLVKLIEAGAKPMTMQEAAAKGKACGYCIRCGALLTDPKSVSDGIGPVCKGYWS